MFGALQAVLGGIIPSARLEKFDLVQCKPLRLYLLNADYPQAELSAEEVQRIMDNPLYWAFCWASGQVLAAALLADPAWVKGKRVLDFGCGSGVIAIAAAMAGAREVIACDIDPVALEAAQLNAALNDVRLTLVDDFAAVTGPLDLIIVADVLYDASNYPWLERLKNRASKVLIADSRVQDFNFPPYRLIDRVQSCTLPDLDESEQFRDVRLYLAS